MTDHPDAAHQRLAQLVAQAATEPKPASLVLFLTTSGGLHHMVNCAPGALGVLHRGPDIDGLKYGMLHLSLAESSYIETILAYLLVTAVADVEANPPEPRRRVAEVYFKRRREVWEEQPREVLTTDLQGNMSDLTAGLTSGAALLQRPVREFLGAVPGAEVAFRWIESAAALGGVEIKRDDSWAGIFLRAIRARPEKERDFGYRGRVLETSDGGPLHSTGVYLQALALNDRWPGILGGA